MFSRVIFFIASALILALVIPETLQAQGKSAATLTALVTVKLSNGSQVSLKPTTIKFEQALCPKDGNLGLTIDDDADLEIAHLLGLPRDISVVEIDAAIVLVDSKGKVCEESLSRKF